MQTTTATSTGTYYEIHAYNGDKNVLSLEYNADIDGQRDDAVIAACAAINEGLATGWSDSADLATLNVADLVRAHSEIVDADRRGEHVTDAHREAITAELGKRGL